MLKRAADGPLKHVLQYTEEELVSSDFKHNPYSSIVDGKLTDAQGDLIQTRAVVRQRVGLLVPARRRHARWSSRRRRPRV